MTESCSACNGKGYIETIEDKLINVMKRLYTKVTIKENMRGDQNYLIYISEHTDYNGGEEGDIITYREIEKFKALGFEIASISKKYIYLKKCLFL